MSRTTNFTALPPRFRELWEWIVAFDAFDFGDPKPLAHLLRTADAVPTEAQEALAAIIMGQRAPNRRAASKLKVPAAERMRIAGSISVILGLVDIFKFGSDGMEGGRLIDLAADRERVEPVAVVRNLEGEGRSAIEDAAAQLGVSRETIENLLRDFRKKF